MIHADPFTFITALTLGLMGSTHCIGMCGGIAGALTLGTPGTPGQRFIFPLGYNCGRILSYTLGGALIGSIASGLGRYHSDMLLVLRLLAGILLIVMGAYLSGIWQGMSYIEHLGQWIWRPIQPIAARLIPIRHPGGAVMAGVIWGWLPCGLVYTALGWSATAGSCQASATLMFGFGLGTLPSMLATGVFAGSTMNLIRHPRVRFALGGLVLLFGVWTIAGVMYMTMQGHGAH